MMMMAGDPGFLCACTCVCVYRREGGRPPQFGSNKDLSGDLYMEV